MGNIHGLLFFLRGVSEALRYYVAHHLCHFTGTPAEASDKPHNVVPPRPSETFKRLHGLGCSLVLLRGLPTAQSLAPPHRLRYGTARNLSQGTQNFLFGARTVAEINCGHTKIVFNGPQHLQLPNSGTFLTPSNHSGRIHPAQVKPLKYLLPDMTI